MEAEKTTQERKIYQTTITGSAVDFLLLIFKFFAGIVGHSAAMLAEAVHSLSDFIVDIIILIFVHIANKPIDKGHDFGHGKFETLATAIIGVLLLFVGFGILYDGCDKIYDAITGKVLNQPGLLAFIAAIVSIGSKELLYRYTLKSGKKYHSQATVANAWHHRSDALSSVGTAVGIGGAILLGEHWRVLDPVAAVLVSIFIIKAAFSLLKPCMGQLLEKSLSEDIEKKIVDATLSFPGVTKPHDLRTRQIGNNYAIDLHVLMDGDISLNKAHGIATNIENKLKAMFGKNTFVSIHVEPKDENNKE
jgi:cation diffusion facilitator family transporter